MIFLLLSIVFTATLSLWFKFFQKQNIELSTAISTNYFVCAVLGLLVSHELQPFQELASTVSGVYVFFQSVLLVVDFYLLAIASQRIGIAVATLAGRLSVLVPVVASFFLFGDVLSLPKFIGIIVAVVSLYLVLVPGRRTQRIKLNRDSLLLFLTFCSFGAYFLLLKCAQQWHLQPSQHHAYVASCFALGFLFSLFGIRFKLISWRSIRYGVLLGLCNYCGVFFLLKALAAAGAESSAVFPSFAAGIVALSSLGAFILFRERLSYRKLSGIVLGLVAVVLLNQ